MQSQIQTLPKEVVSLIAAGEVIDSLAAVVRELVENSLDAGATRIIVSIISEQWRVQISDNGMGMNLANLKRAANPHSTSKITNLQDLTKISSLGFRGEALHSLANLSNLEILSRPKSPLSENENEGWRVVYDQQGKSVKAERVAIAPGTIVKVSHIFGKWPVRRKGMPSPPQQMRGIQLIIQQIALCYPDVTWQIWQGSKLWIQISPGATAKQILPQILSTVRLNDLQYIQQEIDEQEAEELNIQTSSFSQSQDSQLLDRQSLELVLGLPDRCHRRRPDWVKVGINGRVVKVPELEQTIISSLARTCPGDRYPLCFIHLQIFPYQINWNRHPTKTEIYLDNLKFWQQQINLVIGKALQFSSDIMPEFPLSERVEKLLKVSENTGNYQVRRAIEVSPDNTEQKKSKLGLIELKAIAQLHNTYIVAEHPSGIWLIEQHIAHERILYEELCDAWEIIFLETPIILHHLSPAQIEQLQRLNIEIETFGDLLWAARSAPKMLAKRNDCADALIELSKGGDLESAKVATACRSAIRNGTPLSLPEMQSLLNKWQLTHNPRTCPHGRPIYLPLEESALSRFFRRNWVIGKSHGI
ncbi:MAG: DNA mismatch repair endonuclease MutL [Trichodesmium sp. St16_bin4-tuft]|nr:DNA mismatch repair endonuclease MutL [Trichodesmium sp. St4_bin8_1]MDE5077010.1 DNA mismatch repair endonuclease MutL [Trichodesmium sp. St2_bin6]MDE5100704.1 DNA mismatch repair endonuclease MutL [Trichodesmium sp. St16_bin4-tuft]